MRAPLLLPALLLLSPLCAGAVSPPAAPTPPTAPAAGTARQDQVRRGEILYFQACAICHGDRQQGDLGPALSGDDFRATFGGGQVDALHTVITTTMPEDRPGSLSAQEALDVTAYLLDVNALPRPDGELGPATPGAPTPTTTPPRP